MEYKTVQLNCARNSLRYLIKLYGIKEIYIPYYLCNCIRHAIMQENCKIKFYHINKNFTPVQDFNEHDFILYPNYWGINSRTAKNLALKYKNLIIDNAQAFYTPPFGLASFNSLRKFFPTIRNGSILYTKKLMPEIFNKDTSEYELQNLDYNDIIQNEKRIDESTIEYISDTTAKYFSAIQTNDLKCLRLKNFHKFHNQLKASNCLKINLTKDDVPFCYPYLAKNIEQANDLVKKLESEGKTIYRYWNNLPDSYQEKVFYTQLVAIPLI